MCRLKSTGAASSTGACTWRPHTQRSCRLQQVRRQQPQWGVDGGCLQKCANTTPLTAHGVVDVPSLTELGFVGTTHDEWLRPTCRQAPTLTAKTCVPSGQQFACIVPHHQCFRVAIHNTLIKAATAPGSKPPHWQSATTKWSGIAPKEAHDLWQWPKATICSVVLTAVHVHVHVRAAITQETYIPQKAASSHLAPVGADCVPQQNHHRCVLVAVTQTKACVC